MEAKVSQSIQLSAWLSLDKPVRYPNISLHFHGRCREGQRLCSVLCTHLQSPTPNNWRKSVGFKISCSSQKITDRRSLLLDRASLLESESASASLEEHLILKNKAAEIEEGLSGKCIYLVGMMGSGKTTVGRILSEALGYSCIDSDFLIEEAVGGITVAEIFKSHGENCFRENETEILHKLSLMHRLVVSTGGGAVIRPINWKYMHKGISVWLDVPLDALARRIVAVGTDSRPLLHHKSSDAYTKTLNRLETLFEERADNYAKAKARVSLESIAAKLGYRDICNLTPCEIAFEALIQIEQCLKK